MSNILKEEIARIRQMMLSEEMVQSGAYKKLKETLDILKKKDKFLLLSCSNRYNWDEEILILPNQKSWRFI